MYPFSYAVVIYGGNNTYIRETGMGIAKSFSEAAAYLEDYYGPDLIFVKHLELYEEGNLIILPEEVIKKVSTDHFYGMGKNCDVNGELIVKTS